MNFDPTLKKAIMEIEGVMRKYDIAGVISLTSQTHGEYLFSLDASWTIIKQLPSDMGTLLHLKSLRKEYPSDEAQLKANELTAHLIWSQIDILRQSLKQLELIKSKLESNWKVDHETVDLQKSFFKG